MAKKRHVTDDLNPQHHRVRRSNLTTLHQFEHYMYCHRYPVCGTEHSVALCCCLSVMWTVIFYWQYGIAFINDTWLLLPIRGAQISGAWSTGQYNLFWAPNICGSLVWNWLHITVIEPNICDSLVWNWLHVTDIEPNICGSLVWNWLHVTVLAPGVVSWLLHMTTDWTTWYGVCHQLTCHAVLLNYTNCNSELLYWMIMWYGHVMEGKWSSP